MAKLLGVVALSGSTIFAMGLATHAFAQDLLTWQPPAVMVGPDSTEVVLTFRCASPRSGIEFMLRFDHTKIDIGTPSVLGDVAQLRGSAVRITSEGTIVGVLFDDVGRNRLGAGTHELLRIPIRPVGSFRGVARIEFQEVLVAADANRSVPVITVPLDVHVDVAVSELTATQLDDGRIEVSWYASSDERDVTFDVLRAKDSAAFQLVTERPLSGSGPISFVDGSEEVQIGGNFSYGIVAHTQGGDVIYGPVHVVATDRSIPRQFALHPLAPNPSRGATIVRYDVAQQGRIDIKIYDIAGRLVRTLVEVPQAPGRRVISWDGRNQQGWNVAAGIYFVRMQAPSYTATRKLVHLR